MTNRYSPWWLPTAFLASLFCCVGLLALVISGVATSSTISDGPQAQSQADTRQFHWRMVTTWPKNFPGIGIAPENFAKLVSEMSNGRLKVTVHGANEIVPAMGVFDAVSAGSVEMGHGAAYYWKGKIPAAPLFATVPFGLNAQEHNGWLHYGGGLELYREAYEPFNLIPFAAGNTGVQMGGWFNREIHSVADLKGLKMRIPGYAGEVLSRAGGTAVNIPGGELYTALQTGVIDATEWVGPYNDLAFGFHQIAKYYYSPGWHEPGPSLEIIINLNAYNRLPADLKAIVASAARTVNQDMLDEYTVRNLGALQELVEKHQVQLREFPDEVLAAFKRISFELYEETAAKDPVFAKVYESYKSYLDKVKAYHRISEEAYYRTR